MNLEPPFSDAGARDGSPSDAERATEGGSFPDDASVPRVGADAASEVSPLAPLYASPEGTGDHCTRSAPCSLVTARDEARARPRTESGTLSIILLDGVYELAETLRLGPEDGGSDTLTVEWVAENPGAVVLSGATRLTGTWTPVAGSPYGVWQVAVGELPSTSRTRSLFIVRDGDHGGAVRSRRTWSEENPPGFIPTAAGYAVSGLDVSALYHPERVEVVSRRTWKVHRCRVDRASPGAVTMAEPCWSLARHHASQHPGTEMGEVWYLENAAEWLREPGQHYWDWDESALYYIPHDGEDPNHRRVYFPRLSRLLDIEGELTVPVTHLRFEGIRFAYATWPDSVSSGYPALQAGIRVTASGLQPTPAAVRTRLAHDIEFRDVTFASLDHTALLIDRGSQRVVVERSRFHDVGGTAVQVGFFDHPHPGSMPAEWSRREMEVVDNAVRDSWIVDPSAIFWDIPAILIGYAWKTEIAHNRIDGAPYSGISLGWGWRAFGPLPDGCPGPSAEAEYRTYLATVCTTPRTSTWMYDDQVLGGCHRIIGNHVVSSMRVTSDGGGIYVLGRIPGTVVRENVVDMQVNDYAALYLDGGTEGVEVTRNVVRQAPYAVLVQAFPTVEAVMNTVHENYASAHVPARITNDLPDTHCWYHRTNVVQEPMPIDGTAEAIAAAAGPRH